MTTRAWAFALLLTGFVLVTSTAWAQDACQSAPGNLVTNCGFETGDFTGWTQSGNTGFTSVSPGPWAYSGSWGAALGPVGSDGYLSQFVGGNSFSFQFRNDPSGWDLDSIVVSPFASCGTNCETYYVSFWLANIAPVGTNDFTVLWNGVDVGPDLVDAGVFNFEQFSGFLNGTGNFTTTPEPGSLMLMGSGLIGIAGLVRRKLKA